jgi:signal-transduction protein with cAMP-binding, CBS, and nucleotidyltransferase domain
MQPLTAQAIFDDMEADGLQSGSIFGAISQEAIQFLVENGKVYSVRQDEEIFSNGDPGGSFFIVCRGSVDFFKHHQEKYAYTRTAMPGGEIGFVAMIALHDHVGKAVAREDGIVLEISSELFADLHEKYPFDFGIMTLNLARDLARIVRKLSNILVEHAIEH